jgi:nucleotide-binding universal stress UspA family protein
MKILVPLDGSQAAEAAIPIALRLAGEPKSSLVLLGVANARFSEEPEPAEPGIAPVQDARSYLEAAKSHLVPGIDGAIATVWTGPAAAAIVKAAQRYGVDMIVMTTHGRSGRERDMFGSVADAVLRQAPMPVLVLRSRRDVACQVGGSTRAVV